MTVVYIASPYTIGDRETNVSQSLAVASTLIDLGFCPIAPLLSHYIHTKRPKKYETWMKIDFKLIYLSDCLLRLPGESKGADAEVKYATECNKPVFTSIDDLRLWRMDGMFEYDLEIEKKGKV